MGSEVGGPDQIYNKQTKSLSLKKGFEDVASRRGSSRRGLPFGPEQCGGLRWTLLVTAPPLTLHLPPAEKLPEGGTLVSVGQMQALEQLEKKEEGWFGLERKSIITPLDEMKKQMYD